MNAHINGWLEKVCSNKIKAYLTIGTGLGKWNKDKSLESILVPCEDGTCIDVIDLLDSLSEDREEAIWLIYKMASNWVSIYSVNSFPEIWKLYSSRLIRDPDNVELKRMVEDCWADIKKDFIDIYVTHSTFMSYDIFY